MVFRFLLGILVSSDELFELNLLLVSQAETVTRRLTQEREMFDFKFVCGVLPLFNSALVASMAGVVRHIFLFSCC